MMHRFKTVLCVAVSLTLVPVALHAEPKPANQSPVIEPDELEGMFSQGIKTQRLPGGAILKQHPETELNRQPDIKLRLGAQGRPATRTYVYHLARGRVDVSFPEKHREQVAVLIIAPNGQSGVIYRGHGTVVAQPNAISFTARKHRMLTGKGSRWRQLPAGKTFAFEQKQQVFKEVAIPARAQINLNTGLTFAVDNEGFTAELFLGKSAGATSYRVDVFKRQGKQWTPSSSFFTSSLNASISGRNAGVYAVVVHPQNQFDIEGEASAPVALRVVGVQLPTGAFQTPEGITLTPDQHLTLAGIDGLRMTYGSGKYFVKAREEVSLSRSKPTTVHLLDPSTRQKARLNLLPRVVLAQIELGPPSAVWPDDQVQAQVELVDALGQPAQNTQGFNADISINLKPAKARWKHEGNIMHALVSPPPGSKGPWVVRVAVKNPRGHVIGRNFLEIARR